MLNVVGVGVAKSRLIGTHDEPGQKAGSSSKLMDGPDQIGIVLRTQDDVRPLFVSVGNRIDLPSARRLVLACCTRYRLPEPTRQADIEVGRMKE
jgi:deoxyribonuclease V